MAFDPIVKWSGSKKFQATEIMKLIPKNSYNNYYEPFCGGCAILYRLLNEFDAKNDYLLRLEHEKILSFNSFRCSDINSDLIAIFNIVKSAPNELIDHYRILHAQMVTLKTVDAKKDFYNVIRQRYNQNHDPKDFFFIMRTAFNGMPRYNKKGDFTTSYHVTRNGMSPDRLESIMSKWHKVLSSHNVSFETKSYKDIETTENDLMYLDPPYARTKGLYFGNIEYEEFWEWLGKQRCKWIMSFDGNTSKGDDFTYDVPSYLYKTHSYLYAGNSTFRRIIGNSSDTYIKESVYTNFEVSDRKGI